MALGLWFAVAVLGASPAAASAELISPGLWRKPLADASLYRYVPATKQTGPAVLIAPELGLGRGAYDGLARFLQRRGREVFVLVPADGDGPLAERAAGQLASAVTELEAQKRDRFDCIGHGFGGALVLSAPGAELCRRVVAIAVPVDAEIPNARAEAVLSGQAKLDDDAFEFLFARHALIPTPRLKDARDALRPLGPRASAELLGWMRAGNLPLSDGASVQSRLLATRSPVFLVLPASDYFVHPETASTWRDRSTSPVQVRLMSKLYLDREDYTHLSVLLGDGAPVDVFPRISAFLDGATP